MERFSDVTLEQAYRYVREEKCSFVFWTVEGNYLEVKNHVKGENIKTRVFLSESIFLLGLSVEVDGCSVVASKSDFLDIWSSIKIKYPTLFEKEVKGEVMLIP